MLNFSIARRRHHFKGFFNRLNGWMLVALAIALLVSTPILVILSSSFSNTAEVWKHLLETVLGTYVLNSLALMVGVGIGTTTIGTVTAWLVSLCDFPGRRGLNWALLLPLAAPAYILAYVYTELLEYYGIVQTTLRAWFGWQSVQDYWFPSVRSLPGAIVLLTLVLYPYVYLLARSAFLSQSVAMLEASRSLGCNPWRSFWTIALPIARPGITAGLALALMETLADYGTVQFFAVDTFTTGIYRTWFGLNERLAASQLAVCLLLFIFGLIFLERRSRGQARYFQTNSQPALPSYRLSGIRAVAAIVICLVPIALGFLLPAGILLQMATENVEQAFNSDFWSFATNSLTLASVTAAIAVLIAVILAYGQRLNPSWSMRVVTQTAAMGYAIPGAVIAVGILVPLGTVDNAIAGWLQATFGISSGLLLSGTIAALVFAYLVRFLAVSFNSVDASLTKIKPNLDDAARSLGHGTTSTLLRIHAPLIRHGLLTATILVFVDVMKELPATLIVRPFNFDTLAVRVYNLASDERLAEASGAALAIVVVGLVPVILLNLQITASRRTRRE
jgi:iron(III) transport system permease protein